MVRQYCSFLVRCWHLANGERRVRVEHVQTGEVLHAATLEDTLAWMDARAAVADGDAPGGVSATPPEGQGAPEPPMEPGDL
jgi:hypothetical protein